MIETFTIGKRGAGMPSDSEITPTVWDGRGCGDIGEITDTLRGFLLCVECATDQEPHG
jgi:hypothetical protein